MPISMNNLANGTDIGTGAITTAKIADGNITLGKLSSTVTQNSILQIVSSTTSLATMATTVVTSPAHISGIPDLSLTRKTTTSKILMELTGGQCLVNSASLVRTYFYISQNGGAYANFDGTSNPVEAQDEGSGPSNKPHCARALFTPASNITTITLRVYYALAATTGNWHVNTNSVPIILTMTEIAS